MYDITPIWPGYAEQEEHPTFTNTSIIPSYINYPYYIVHRTDFKMKKFPSGSMNSINF